MAGAAIGDRHPAPFNLMDWVERTMAGEMGSVGNREVFRDSDFIFMMVKGPNARNDFHVNPYDEIFYQLRGTIFLHMRTGEGAGEVAEIKEGDVYLCPAGTPHSPRRPAGTLGLVVERPRVAGEEDGILWFCEGCGSKLDEVRMRCEDIEAQLKAVLDGFNGDQTRRTCRSCGAVLPPGLPATG